VVPWFLGGSIEVRPVRLIFTDLAGQPVCFFHEILLGHAEVLVFKLLNSAFKRPVFISELDEFGVDFVDRGHLGVNGFEGSSSSKLAVFGVAPIHDALDLLGDHFVVVLAVVL